MQERLASGHRGGIVVYVIDGRVVRIKCIDKDLNDRLVQSCDYMKCEGSLILKNATFFMGGIK